MKPPDLARFEGCLLGMMVGDCLGLPREGLSPRRAERLFGRELRHAFLFGRGMASDDTELACMTAQAFAAQPGDAAAFASALGWKLRWWLIGLPAGIGLATLRAIFKLWIGFPASASGVRSAGNGPLLRSPVLGLACWADDAKMKEFVMASTRLTHTDERAERGALALAFAVSYAATHERGDFSAAEVVALIASAFPKEDKEAARWLAAIEESDAAAFVAKLGFERGVSGYAYHTLPAAFWAWLKSPFDFDSGIRRIILLGGDSDSTAAVFGALSGATVGAEGIPAEWIRGICEFPRSPAWVLRAADRLHAVSARASDPGEVSFAWWLIPFRNAFFLLVVLTHGFRRMLPPYS